MDSQRLTAELASLDETALIRLARIADPMLASPPGFSQGPWPSRRRAGEGQEFHDFAPHPPGGDARRIDWRASARARRLLERRHLDASSSRWCLCLDLSPSMGRGDAAKRLLSLQLAAAMAYLLLHREHEVGLVGFSDRISTHCRPGRGRAQYARLLACLAQDPPPARDSRLELCLQYLSRRQAVVVVSDFLAEDAMCGALARLRRHTGTVHALQVLAADECQVDAAGGPRLVDTESGQTLAVTDLERAAAGARAALASQQRRLREFCQRHDVAFSVCPVGDSWQLLLLRHLLQARRADA